MRTRARQWIKRVTATAICVLATLVLLDHIFPLPLPDNASGSTVVLSRDGTPLRAFADDNGVWRYPVTPEQVSPLYLDALLNYEDRWFWSHPGVNPFALARAVGQMLWYRRPVSGGSTLTMQVARIIDPNSRSVLGKCKQVLRALQLEVHLSKKQILELYLDYAPFGGSIQGVQAASYAYLGKSADHLSRAEAALLAVLPQSPSRLRPDREAAAAQAARDKVLDRMRDLHVWTAAEIADAKIESVATRTLTPPLKAALLAERLREANPGARSIRTTIDAELQSAMEARVTAYLAHLPERTSAALLVVDNATAETLAYVGSGAFAEQARLGHVDMVRAWRSPGSTLKPFLYGLALDDGLIDSESLLLDAPQSFGSYRPANFSETFSGPVGAAQALRLSLNVPAVDLLDRVGAARFMARLANGGLTLRLPRGADPNLSIILGGAGARLEDLVGAYTAFNRGGVAARVRLTSDDVLTERRLLSEGAAWIVRTTLEANPRPGYGSDTFDTSGKPRVAWKTGTSYGFRDAWAIGATRRYTLGVWVGRPDGTPMPGQYGAVTALPLLFQAVDSLPRNTAAALLADAPPPSVREAEVCWPLGLTFDPARPGICHEKRTAWILNDVVPPTLPDRDADAWSAAALHIRVDAQTGMRLSADCSSAQVNNMDIARWPALAYPWLSPALRRRASLPALAPGCAPDALDRVADLRIGGIGDGATIARAPGTDKPPQLSLKALGANGPVMWLVNGKLEGETSGARVFVHAFADTGVQTITALTPAGAYSQVQIRVLR
ncbi:MAG: penicillin-binding protein 1C [Rudaea sp.]|nr:penicillin-binding protein 1C [Rudaea sp.]